MTDADAAMKKGDWVAYGEAQKRLEAAVKKALEAEEAQSAASAKAQCLCGSERLCSSQCRGFCKRPRKREAQRQRLGFSLRLRG